MSMFKWAARPVLVFGGVVLIAALGICAVAGSRIRASAPGAEEGGLVGRVKEIMPCGAILPYSGDQAPEGWLLCNGDAKRIENYGDLYGVVGNRYQGRKPEVNGIFYLPDLRGRSPLGAGTGIAGDDPAKNLSERVLGNVTAQ